MRYIVLAFLVAISLQAQNNLKYMDESKFNYFDPRIFVGLDAGYNYNRANDKLDRFVYSYGGYVGIPVFDYEMIVKKKFARAEEYELLNNSLTLNFPYNGTGARQAYWGIIAGQSTIDFKRHSRYNLQKAQNDGTFYGIHFGQRNKYTRNVFVRYELEYLRYDMDIKQNDGKDFGFNHSLEFIVGVEYRF